MSFNMHCADRCAHRYIHAIPDRQVQQTARLLESSLERQIDISDLCFDALAHQLLVRDLRSEAANIGIDDFIVLGWQHNPFRGALEVVFEFGSEADMVHFRLRVG